MHHLLSAADLDLDEIAAILDLAEEMAQVQSRPVKKLPALRGRTVVNLFFEDSTRTRSSFELAGKWLSADVINISAKGSSVSKGESLRDTVLTVAAMGVDALVIRHHASGAPWQTTQWFAELGIEAAVLNAGDGTHEHPTQALLDAFTMRRHFRPAGADPAEASPAGRWSSSATSPTPGSPAATCCCSPPSGRRVIVVAPPTLLPAGVGSWPVEVETDLDRVLPEGDVVMMLRVQRERMSGGYFPTPREYTVGYGLTRDRLCALTAGRGDLPPRSDEPGAGDLRRRRRRRQLADPGPGLGRGRGADERALPAAGRGDEPWRDPPSMHDDLLITGADLARGRAGPTC